MRTTMPVNLLYYGDNLDILRRYISDESVDLIYLDPPFKSNQDYNVLFGEEDGSRAAAQIKAFGDTWRWDVAAVAAFQETVAAGGRVAQALDAFHTLLGGNDMLAYLSMMAPRLVELRRVLKSTGSIYLHCDPTASHYLKVLMDAIFGPKNCLNEVIWKRTSAHNDPGRWGRVHDSILFYSRQAAALAEQDRFQFQWWALGLVGARPTPIEQKKGADKGIDGRLFFFDDPHSGKAKLIVFSVKSGHLKATDVRDLRGVIDRG